MEKKKTGRKKGEKVIPVYVTEKDMKTHFKEVANKRVQIIDRQFEQLGKITRARTYVYTQTQIDIIIAHLTDGVESVKQSFAGKSEKPSFNVGE